MENVNKKLLVSKQGAVTLGDVCDFVAPPVERKGQEANHCSLLYQSHGRNGAGGAQQLGKDHHLRAIVLGGPTKDPGLQEARH